VRAGARRAALVTAVAFFVALAGCAGRRIQDGVFRSEHGYRVRLPAAGWNVVDDGRADLELRREDGKAGMLANATCRVEATRRSYDLLERHLLLGLRDRATLEEGEADVAGRRGFHRVIEGRPRSADDRVRIESYVLKDGRCVYDLLYVAPPEAFESGRGDFQRFVQSFTME
jgi:hypothetical protein